MLKNLCLKPKNVSCLLVICLLALVFLNLFSPKTDLVFAADSNIVPQNTPTPTRTSPTPQESVVFNGISFSDITSTSVTISLSISRYTSRVWPISYSISFSDGIESIKGEIPVDKALDSFVLTGLKPSTKYSYEVTVAAYGGSARGSFETLNSDNIPTPTPTPKCFISGRIKLDLNSSNIKTLHNFTVDILDRDLICIRTTFSDSQGNFYTGSIPESGQPYTVKISKKSYLPRTVANFPAGISNVGVEMWAGDIKSYVKRFEPISNSYEYILAQDNIIDIRDVYEIAKCFNTVISDDLFNSECDLNEDGVINMLDVLIVSKNFGKSSADYSSELTTI